MAVKKNKARKKVAPTRSKASSVDGILKRYQKERIAHESKLVSVRDQIHKLTSKIQTYQKQIVKLKSQQLDTENSICTLDIRRDQEVAGLLSSLGINLDSIASIGESVGKKKVDKSVRGCSLVEPTDEPQNHSVVIFIYPTCITGMAIVLGWFAMRTALLARMPAASIRSTPSAVIDNPPSSSRLIHPFSRKNHR